MSSQTIAKFPDKLDFLFEPHRYKVAYGGRGSGKSWSMARALLIKAANEPTRVLCAREIQKSIKQSVHTLLNDQIQSLGLELFMKFLSQKYVVLTVARSVLLGWLLILLSPLSLLKDVILSGWKKHKQYQRSRGIF